MSVSMGLTCLARSSRNGHERLHRPLHDRRVWLPWEQHREQHDHAVGDKKKLPLLNHESCTPSGGIHCWEFRRLPTPEMSPSSSSGTRANSESYYADDAASGRCACMRVVAAWMCEACHHTRDGCEDTLCLLLCCPARRDSSSSPRRC